MGHLFVSSARVQIKKIKKMNCKKKKKKKKKIFDQRKFYSSLCPASQRKKPRKNNCGSAAKKKIIMNDMNCNLLVSDFNFCSIWKHKLALHCAKWSRTPFQLLQKKTNKKESKQASQTNEWIKQN